MTVGSVAVQKSVRLRRTPTAQLQRTWRAFRRERLAMIGLVIAAVFIATAPLAGVLGPHDPNAALPAGGLVGPGWGHLLGTDQQGRDVLSRLIFATRVAVPVAILPVTVGLIVSIPLGVFAAYRGGFVETVIMRGLDILFAFPMVLLAIATATALGAGILNVMLALSITLVPYMTRVIYSAAKTTMRSGYVDAARIAGAGSWEVIMRQILPNAISPLIVYATVLIGQMVILGAGLSFLGVGVQPPQADWGIMLSDGRSVLTVAWWVSTMPGIAIVIVSLAFNWVGDGLRNALDPRLAER